MSMHIIATLASCFAPPARIRELLDEEGIRTSPNHYDGAALFKALTGRYGWDWGPALLEGRDAVTLDSADLGEIQDVTLPDGRAGKMLLLWPDGPQADPGQWPEAYLLDMPEDNPGDGIRLVGFWEGNETVILSFATGEDLGAMRCGPGENVVGWSDTEFFENKASCGFLSENGKNRKGGCLKSGSMDQLFAKTESDSDVRRYICDAFHHLRTERGVFHKIVFRQVTTVDPQCLL